MMKQHENRRFSISLIASVLIHAALIFTSMNMEMTKNKLEKPVEIQIVDKTQNIKLAADARKKEYEEKLKKQVVDQNDESLNDETPDKTRFLGAKNQTVKKQTVAQHHGNFRNNGMGKPTSDKIGGDKNPLQKFVPKFDVIQAVEKRLEKEKQQELEATMKAQNPQPKPQVQAQATEEGSAGSATLDYIKELDPGLETLLSTREFVFYSYYSRIRKQLNQYWGPKIQEKLTKIYKQGRNIASEDDKVTRCLITLDSIGNLLKVQIIGQSGISELDEAAVEAFRAAAPFPNPPDGIKEKDGTIKIRWDFILEA